MSTSVVCPNCKSDDLSIGYGFAAGILGGYVICNQCDTIVEHTPDSAGTDDDPYVITDCGHCGP